MTPEELSHALTCTLHDALDAGVITLPSSAIPSRVSVERPKDRAHGDWATTIALQLATAAGMSPRELAGILQQRFMAIPAISSVEIAGPGFLNIVLTDEATGAVAHHIVQAGAAYGSNETMSGQVVNLEFVSANPTGPLHIGHTRWAALGDALARLLRACGARVTTEYYVNDAGTQMDRFGASILAALRGEPTPEGGYPGAYIADLATHIRAEHPDLPALPDDEALPLAREAGYQVQLADIQQTLVDFDVHFDVYFSEQTLHRQGAIARAIDRLRAGEHLYEENGALWLRTTDFGDDKDRVLVRSTGEPTYFAADAAYYLSKKERGFEKLIFLLGADHHGYIGRLRALAACFGDDPDRDLEVLIGQLISIDGARLSKRAGNVVELRDLLETVGTDALRYSLARRPADTSLALDADEIKRASNDNPIFYVQYAHARTAAVARNAATAGLGRTPEAAFDAATLNHPRESDVLAQLAAFPSLVAESARLREPHRIARHLEVIAGAYHRWYDACRVTPPVDEPITDTHHSRLWLNNATGQVLANGLHLLGVSAPERM